MSPAPRRPLVALGSVRDWPGTSAVAVLDLSGPGGPSPLGSTGPVDRPFEWASLTKPATALAVLVAAEEGILSLDEPAGPSGSTVRHLLAHASGLGPDPGPPVARPGVTRIYSNPGFQLLGELVAARARMDFADYLRDGVLAPLGMTATTLDAAAVGAPAAAGLHGPLTDLLHLGAEWAAPTLVATETHDAARRVAFPGLPGVLPGFGRFDPCDWGLGVEIRGGKQPHWTGADNDPATYGHYGRAGSFLWIDPSASVLCAGLGDRDFGPWAARAWPRLADDILRELATSGTEG
jgi:CubicO group peptidase (beta-lactamase class C family)